MQQNQFYKEAEGLLYGAGIVDESIITVSNQKLILFSIENFEAAISRVFIFTIFLNLQERLKENYTID